MPPVAHELVPFAHVADVQRSIHFYSLLGFAPENVLTDDTGRTFWAWLQSEEAALMLAYTESPVIPEHQAVLFYLYTKDVAALRQHLLASGIEVSEIKYPPHMDEGEIELADPDGYTLLVGQME